MLTEGNLLYFTPFHFPDGKTEPKPKYFVVLKTVDKQKVLGSLPTRTDHVPASKDNQFGCIKFEQNTDGFDMVCFRILPDEIFLENGVLPFHAPTHLYGETLKLYKINYFDEYPYEGLDYRIVGKIKKDYFNKIKKCLKNSPAVKRGIRNLL
jgi:hypothetical protein